MTAGRVTIGPYARHRLDNMNRIAVRVKTVSRKAQWQHKARSNAKVLFNPTVRGKPRSNPAFKIQEKTDWHGMLADEAIARLGSDRHHGLSHPEVQKRLRQFGRNRLPSRRNRPGLAAIYPAIS